MQNESGFFSTLGELIKGNFGLISKSDAMSAYKKCKFDSLIIGELKTSNEFNSVIDDKRKKFSNKTKHFVDKVTEDTNMICNEAKSTAENIRNVLDHSDEYKANKDELEKKANVLHDLEECIKPFKESWRSA